MKRSLFIIVCFLFVQCLTKAQEVTVAGRIFDSQGLEVPGASIVIKEKPIGTVSDMEGRYAL